MEQKFCQSCGMPLNPEVLGTEKDGSKTKSIAPIVMPTDISPWNARWTK